MIFLNKLKWVLGILIIFILILTTNLIDRNNFERVKNSVVTIYEDRLIANDLIFEISKLVHEKEMAIVMSDTIFYKKNNTRVNDEISNLISRYEFTKLTPEESKIFKDLKKNFKTLVNAESSPMELDFNNEN